MRAALIISLLIAVAATIFAVQNPQSTTLNVGSYEIQSTVALIILVTFLLGVIVGILAGVPAHVRARRRVKQLERASTESGTSSYSATTDPLASRPSSGTS